jgi:drug/metabolite transporter (DMT)-like permease
MGLVVDGRGLLPLTSPEEAGGLAHMAVLVTALGFVLWYSSVERLGVEWLTAAQARLVGR